MPLWNWNSAKQLESFRVKGIHMTIRFVYVSYTFRIRFVYVSFPWILISILPPKVCSKPHIGQHENWRESLWTTHHLQAQGVLLGKVEVHLPKRRNSLCCLPFECKQLVHPPKCKHPFCVSDAATELPSHCPQGLEQIQNGQAHQTVTLVASLVATFQQSKQPMMCCTRVTQHEHSTPLKSHHTQKYKQNLHSWTNKTWFKDV